MQLGARIDSFDLVIRINNYTTRGLEPELGSRTDIWVNGANQGLKKRKDPPELILTMIPPVVLREKGEAIHTRIQRRLGTDRYHLIPLEDMETLERFSGIERPTTGLFTILYFYLKGCDISLHGFDFFVSSKGHYFDSRFKRWLKESGIIKKAAKHQILQEKQLVDRLMDEGRLRNLS